MSAVRALRRRWPSSASFPGRAGEPPVGGRPAEVLEGRTLFAAAAAAAAALPPPGPAAAPTLAAAAAAAAAALAHPRVAAVTPAAGATKVRTDAAVSAELSLPNGGVNAATLTSAAVYLVRKSTGKHVPAQLNTSGGGDVVVLKPAATLAPDAAYTFVVTAALKDVKGATFAPFSSSFTTGAAVAAPLPQVKFDQLAQSASAGRNYFGLAMGPDGRLYAGTDAGKLVRFPVKADGSLGTPTVIDTIAKANGGPRFVVGLAFDPASTAAAPVLWVTHSATSSLELGGTAGADGTGKVSRLSGPDLATYRDAVVHLPRSVRDHVTDQPAFGPDGALYFCQPSQTAMGRADPTWGNRPEHLLSASILRLDVRKLGTATLDARTPDGGGSYDPRAAGAPLAVYAAGVRNAFDLVWHRNGSLYAPANGSAAGGNSPAGGGAPALTNVRQAETDYLFRVRPGKYYGHPNPRQGHYVLNGGNPTAGKDPYETTAYPVGTQPDPAWQPAAFDMGPHQSPDGAIEYKGSAFGGALNGLLLVCRYSGGDDVVALALNASGGVAKQYVGVAGLTGLRDPVDLVQDPRTGRLYVSELGARRITLLRPAAGTTASATVAATVAAASTATATASAAVAKEKQAGAGTGVAALAAARTASRAAPATATVGHPTAPAGSPARRVVFAVLGADGHGRMAGVFGDVFVAADGNGADGVGDPRLVDRPAGPGSAA